MDMSSPECQSVNDRIRESLHTLSYVMVWDAAQAVAAKGQETLMAKVDVKSVCRNVPIHPHNQWLMGMLWEGSLYIGTALPFGLRPALMVFTAVADAVEWIVWQERVDFAIYHLDDYLVVGASAFPECAEALTTLLGGFDQLGLPVAMDKLEGPWSRLTFLGFELDSSALEIWLAQAKLRELQHLISTWGGRKSCIRRELKLLVGQ